MLKQRKSHVGNNFGVCWLGKGNCPHVATSVVELGPAHGLAPLLVALAGMMHAIPRGLQGGWEWMQRWLKVGVVLFTPFSEDKTFAC